MNRSHITDDRLKRVWASLVVPMRSDWRSGISSIQPIGAITITQQVVQTNASGETSVHIATNSETAEPCPCGVSHHVDVVQLKDTRTQVFASEMTGYRRARLARMRDAVWKRLHPTLEKEDTEPKK